MGNLLIAFNISAILQKIKVTLSAGLFFGTIQGFLKTQQFIKQ